VTTADSLADLAPLSHAVFRIARLHRMLAGQLLRQAGLYPGQELVMMQLWMEGPQRQVDLVRMLQSEAPTMTRTIQRLEKAGLVRTSRDATDRRSIIVKATKKSASLRGAVEGAWSELEARTVGGLTRVRRRDIMAALVALETELLDAEDPCITT
jgi:MarR family transcriptional regulator, organic hydroperoxide resistance regulator